MSNDLFAAGPLASSYKSIANITSVGLGTYACPDSQVPLTVSGNGLDLFGKYLITEEVCAGPATGVFSGHFDIQYPGDGSYSRRFNGTFVDSGRNVRGSCDLENRSRYQLVLKRGRCRGCQGIATVVNGGPGPGAIFLDGSILLPNN